MHLAFIIATSLTALSGCAWNRQQINVTKFHNKAAAVEAGKTTVKELYKMIGTPPNSTVATRDGGKALVYFFGEAKTEAFTLILFSISKTNLGLDSAIFFVDKNNIVQDFTVSANSNDLPWEWWVGDA